MVQVVTNENMQEFIQNRTVPEFKAPAASESAQPSEPAAAKPADTAITAQEPAKAEQPRGEDGKFVAKVEGETAAKAAVDDDDVEDADLPERVRRQIGRKHRLQKEAEEFAREEYRERKAAEDRAAAAERELNELKSKSGPKTAKDADAPKPEDFKTVADYADALTDYLLEKKLAAREQKQVQSSQARAAEQAQNAFADRIATVAKTIPDYYEVVETADVDVPPHIAHHIVESGDVGVLLGYHFAKHPEELDRIKKLSPTRAIAELGKLEISLEKKPEGKPSTAAAPQVSRAPAPIIPLEGKSTPVTSDPAKMNFQELRAHRIAERAAGKR